LIVAQEKIQDVGGTLAKPSEKVQVKAKCIGRDIESQLRIEHDDAGYNHPTGSEDHHDPEAQHDLSDVCDLPIERENQNHTDARGHQLHLEIGHRHEDLQVLNQAYVPRSDLERTGEEDLPNKEKSHQPSQSPWSETLAQEDISPAGGREGSAQFGNNETVRQGNEHAQKPGEIRMRPAKGNQDQRDRDERADPDHV